MPDLVVGVVGWRSGDRGPDPRHRPVAASRAHSAWNVPHRHLTARSSPGPRNSATSASTRSRISRSGLVGEGDGQHLGSARRAGWRGCGPAGWSAPGSCPCPRPPAPGRAPPPSPPPPAAADSGRPDTRPRPAPDGRRQAATGWALLILGAAACCWSLASVHGLYNTRARAGVSHLRAAAVWRTPSALIRQAGPVLPATAPPEAPSPGFRRSPAHAGSSPPRLRRPVPQRFHRPNRRPTPHCQSARGGSALREIEGSERA